MKILVVEDNEDSRNLLVKQLGAYGHEATAAADGAEALQQALVQPPDIIVSDILMPKMDGYQLCHECKQNEQLKNIPLVFYTATYTLDEDKKFALSLGADAFFTKPTEPDTFVQMLSEVFEKAKSGALPPPEVAPLEPSLFFAEHEKRIFAKLEDKVAQLEAEITERRRTEHTLNERVKELQCLYGIANIAERLAITLDELYQEVANLLPNGWQYPEITCARVTFGDKEFKTDNFTATEWKQSSDIEVGSEKVGALEVYYLEEKAEIDEGPFLKEERLLINAVAERLGRITERKQAEELFRTLASSSPVGIYIMQDRKCRFANLWFQKYTGYSEDELLGMDAFAFVDPEDRERVRQNEVEMLKGTRLSPYEFRYVGKSGETKWAMETVASIQYQGKRATLGNFMDITDRKQAEEKIKRTAEEWSTTFDSITDLVSICGKDFRIIRVNKAFADAFKTKPEELIGKPCYKIVHGASEPVPLCPYKETIKTKKPAVAEFFEPHLGMHLEVSTSPIFDEKGEVVASVHLIRDITERKKMEEQLIVTDRLASIGELSSGIAHELNNPLTSVIGFSELLLDKDVSDDVKEDLRVINREAKRTAGVVRNLLIFARKHPEEKEAVDINKAIQAVLELRAYEQKVNNIEVNTQFAPDLPEITANAFDLQQAFLNIIINAEHFMIEANGRGTLTITTERVGDIVQASFADDGPGIAQENLGHVFDPFFTTKEVGKGTGLGLSICHGIITEHGGRIYAESGLGKGVTFVVELPINKQ